jgi:hypothetical protein
MAGSVKFSFSCRGFSKDSSDDDIRQFFEAVGTIVSWKRVPYPGYPSCSVYVNFSQVNSVNDVLSLNGTVPSFNHGFPISVRQQAVLVAQVATALDEIKFSVSMRGLSWKVSEEHVREALNRLAKLHSVKIAAPPSWVVGPILTLFGVRDLRFVLNRMVSQPKMRMPIFLAEKSLRSLHWMGPTPLGITAASYPCAHRCVEDVVRAVEAIASHRRPHSFPA